MYFAKLLRGLKAWTSLSYSRNVIFQLNPQSSSWSTQQDFHGSQEVLEQILTQNILPFWYPHVIDSEDGGYRLNHDLQGKWKGRTNKRLVTQARTVWFFSRLARTRYGKNEHLEAAQHGYEFLYNQMWDRQFGGFYWEVDSSGENATGPNKHLYGQAFGLYALSEYAITSGDSSATVLARELFSLLEHYAHDSQYGGYLEFFQRDWNLAPAETKSYLRTAPTIKMMNTHLHLLEAITNYYLLTKESIARERLIEMIFIQSNAVVRKTVGACTDKYQHDWTPLYGPHYDRISYGHDLENVWLLIKACDTAGISNSPLLDLYRTLFSYALRYGFDRKKGGFYDAGPCNAPADRREKIWWVQAEGLVSALQMYRLTGEEAYCHCFSQTLDWIVKHQVDWEHGDWYAQVAKNGKPLGDKAGAWKSPYHNGRAMIQCLELLQ
jgi:mannose/cellobiose epimerase-like protein (N-acyl-D-glucosamine 2-epimerase family)